MLGQQLAEQQQQQDFQQNLNLAQLAAGQQDEQNRLLMSQLGNLTPESQARALTNMGAQPNRYAGVLNTPYAQAHPYVAQILGGGQPQAPPAAGAPGGFIGAMTGQQVTPAAAAPAGQLPVGGQGQPTFTLGGQQYALKGFDKAEAARALTDLKKTFDDMAKVDLTDPTQVAQRQAYLDQRARIPQRIETPEQLQQVQSLINAAGNFNIAVGGPAAQTARDTRLRTDQTFHANEIKQAQTLDDASLAGALPGLLQEEQSLYDRRGKTGYAGTGLLSKQAQQQIAEIEQLNVTDPEQAAKLAGEFKRRWISSVTPSQETANFKKAMAWLGQFSPRQITPSLIKQAFTNAGAGHMIEGMSDEQLLGFGSSTTEKEWQKDLGILADPKKWAELPKDVQSQILKEISGTAALTGRKITLPASVVLQMSQKDQQTLAMRQSQIDMQGTRIQMEQARLLLDQRKFDWAMQHPTGAAGGKGSVLTQNARAKQLHDFWNADLSAFNRAMTGNKMTLTNFDPNGTYPPNSLKGRLSGLYQKAEASKQRLKTFLLGQGIDVDTGMETKTPVAEATAASTPGVTAAPAAPGRAPVAGPVLSQPAGVQQPPPTGKPTTWILDPKTGQKVPRRQIYEDLLKRGYKPAEINAALRRRGAL